MTPRTCWRRNTGRHMGASERVGSLLHDREHVARGEDEVLLAVVLDLGTAVLGVHDDVTDADVEGDALLAVLVETPGADRQDLALLGLLLGGVRDDETGRRGL